MLFLRSCSKCARLKSILSNPSHDEISIFFRTLSNSQTVSTALSLARLSENSLDFPDLSEHSSENFKSVFTSKNDKHKILLFPSLARLSQTQSFDSQFRDLATETAESLLTNENISILEKLAISISVSQLSLRSPELFKAISAIPVSEIPQKYLPSFFLAVATLGINSLKFVNSISAQIQIESVNVDGLIDICLAVATLIDFFPISLIQEIENKVRGMELGSEQSLELSWLFSVLNLEESCRFVFSKIDKNLTQEKRFSQICIFLGKEFIPSDPPEPSIYPERFEIEEFFGIRNSSPKTIKNFYISDVPSSPFFVILDDSCFPESLAPVDPFVKLKKKQIEETGETVFWVNLHQWRSLETNEEKKRFLNI